MVKGHPAAPWLADERWRFEEGLAGMYALVLCAPGVCACVHGSEMYSSIRADQTRCEQASFVPVQLQKAERAFVFILCMQQS